MLIFTKNNLTLSSKFHTNVREYFASIGIVLGVVLLTGCSSSGPSGEAEEMLLAAPAYLLSTSFRGNSMVLSAEAVASESDVDDAQASSQLLLALANESSRQRWVFTKLDNGAFNISNEFVGDAFSIDVVNDGVLDKVKLASTAGVSGQSWTLTPLENGYCRLTNNFTGSEIALDISAEGDQNEPRLSAIGNFSGQHWRITNVGGAENANESAINACAEGVI